MGAQSSRQRSRGADTCCVQRTCAARRSAAHLADVRRWHWRSPSRGRAAELSDRFHRAGGRSQARGAFVLRSAAASFRAGVGQSSSLRRRGPGFIRSGAQDSYSVLLSTLR